MDQQERTSTKEVKVAREDKRRASRPLDQRKRNRSRSGSRSSSRSSSSSSNKSESGGKDRTGKPRRNHTAKSKTNINKASPASPYQGRNSSSARRTKKENGAKEDKKANKRPVQENGTAEKNDSNNKNTTTTTNNNNNNDNSNKVNNQTSAIYNRPLTSGARLESATYRGYDNSDRNPNRRNLGSSTDQVADQRPIFGPWRQPDPERQRLLVERLAPAKPPAPPDPRFNHWKNHFLYYWHIGSDPKPRREGNYQGSPRRQEHYQVGRTSAHSHNGYDHRLLKRPKTTSGRIRGDHNNNNNSNNNKDNMRLDLSNHPFTGSASVDGRHGMAQRGTQSAREYIAGDSPRVVSGLDRRYMGLQAVSSTQMQDIVERLTKMTSAYNAKFAPNPHVWVDTEPGAHMVKRSNTTFS